MAEMYAVSKEQLTDIADAIRLKRDITDEMTVDDMPLQIGLIEGDDSIVYEFDLNLNEDFTNTAQTDLIALDIPFPPFYQTDEFLVLFSITSETLFERLSNIEKWFTRYKTSAMSATFHDMFFSDGSFTSQQWTGLWGGAIRMGEGLRLRIMGRCSATVPNLHTIPAGTYHVKATIRKF